MPTAQPAKKVCIVCGVDVDGKPRVKDAQGRYVCKGSCETKLATGGASVGKPGGASTRSPEPDDALAKLIAASPTINAKPCASCGSPIRPGAVVCTNCGTNVESGKKLKTAVIKEKAPKEPGVISKFAASGGPSFGALLLAMTLVFGGIAALGLLHEIGLMASLLILVPIGFVSTIATVVSGFRNGSPLMAFFLTPVYGLLMDPNKWTRALYTSMSIAGVILIVVLMTYGADGLERVGN